MEVKINKTGCIWKEEDESIVNYASAKTNVTNVFSRKVIKILERLHVSLLDPSHNHRTRRRVRRILPLKLVA